jgi:hypothetical protein
MPSKVPSSITPITPQQSSTLASSSSSTSVSPPKAPVMTRIVCGQLYYDIRCLGKGGFGEVMEVMSKTHHRYALKIMKPKDRADRDAIVKEIQACAKVKGKPGVIQLIAHEEKDGIVYILLEVGTGDLHDWLINAKHENKAIYTHVWMLFIS